MRADTERKVRKFIEENFLFREDRADIGDAESLIEAGLIDSTGVLELVAFLEGEFGLRMADTEIERSEIRELPRLTNCRIPLRSMRATVNARLTCASKSF